MPKRINPAWPGDTQHLCGRSAQDQTRLKGAAKPVDAVSENESASVYEHIVGDSTNHGDVDHDGGGFFAGNVITGGKRINPARSGQKIHSTSAGRWAQASESKSDVDAVTVNPARSGQEKTKNFADCRSQIRPGLDW